MHNSIFSFILVCFLSINLLAGCSSTPPQQTWAAASPSLNGADDKPIIMPRSQQSPTYSLIAIAHSMEGVRYHYGGISPRSGFDCSGFMYYIHQQIGVELPRTSVAQFRHTHPVSRQALRPGDMVFFGSRHGRITHVGLYLGSNRFIHAPGKGKYVSVSTLDHPYWQPRFVRGGRI